MPNITFRIDRSVFSLSDYDLAVVESALVAYNQHHEVSGLDAHLNPELISVGKAVAFLMYLKAHAADFPALHQKTVYLHAADLLLGEAVAVSEADLQAGFSLTIPDDNGRLLMPVLHLRTYDADACRQLSQQAHLAFEAAHQRFQAMETQLATMLKTDAGYPVLLEIMSLTRYHRFAAARTWYVNQRLVSQAAPGDQTAADELTQAEAAAHTYLAPPRTGMR